MFAISNTKSSVTANIIKTTVDFLAKTIKQISYDNLINDLVSLATSFVIAGISKLNFSQGVIHAGNNRLN